MTNLDSKKINPKKINFGLNYTTKNKIPLIRIAKVTENTLQYIWCAVGYATKNFGSVIFLARLVWASP